MDKYDKAIDLAKEYLHSVINYHVADRLYSNEIRDRIDDDLRLYRKYNITMVSVSPKFSDKQFSSSYHSGLVEKNKMAYQDYLDEITF